MTSADNALHALVNAEFHWIQAPGYDLGTGHVPYTMLWFRPWDAPYVDLLHVRGRDDVTAIRARTDTADDNLFAHRNIVWQCESDIVETVADLLDLPAPGEPGAPTLTVRAPSRLWTPGDAPTNPNQPSPFSFL